MSQTKIVCRRSLNPNKSKTAFYKGMEFVLGNDRHQEIELYYLTGGFFKVVLKSEITQKKFIKEVQMKGKSLNTTGKLFRARQIEYECKRLRKGLGELFTPEQIDELLNRPITNQERLRNYRGNGRYGNNKTPKVYVR